MRNHIIIGTSGHIDHGKTSMIKALTGFDADRLKEEKERGITIELGFVHYDMAEDKSISFIDVPGHERFIHNMLSGVVGMDAVLLVISADEGIKPQTVEHLNILRILGVKRGAVVLTKVDLVEPSQIEVLKKEVSDFVKDSFLEQQPIFEFSIFNAESNEVLNQYFNSLFYEVPEHVLETSSRLSVDRVFTIKGQGTIVTGTLIEGIVEKTTPHYLYPSVEKIRIRNIQVNGEDVEKATAGQRVALNIPLAKSDISRGNVVSSSESLPVTMMVDVKLFLDDISEVTDFFHWQRVRLHHGTTEIFGRLVVKPEFSIGHPFVQIRLETPLVCKIGDRFVIRNYSPANLLGGGYIVNVNAKKGEITDVDYVNDNEEQIRQLIDGEISSFKIGKKFFESLPLSYEVCLDIFNQFIEKKEVEKVGRDQWCSQSLKSNLSQTLIALLNDFHKKEPLKIGMPKEAIKSKLNIKQKVLFDALLDWMSTSGDIKIMGDKVADVHFKIRYSKAEQKIRDGIIQNVKESAFKPLAIREIYNITKIDKIHYDIFINLINERILVKINEDTVMYCDNYDIVCNKLKTYLKQNDEITVANFRDLLDISRKASILLLEHFDDIKLTKRIEDVRILIK